LGPTLGGLTLGLDAARNSLPADSKVTRELLSELKAQTQEAVSDIRRLVHDLRPPALDDLGLLAAVRQQAAKHGRLAQVEPGSQVSPENNNGLTFSVEGYGPLPPLPAAAEVAAYRVALEAITNVSRHAKARVCRVGLSVNEARSSLTLEVVDDGIGIPADRHAGVGTSSMRERAEELGGTLEIEPATPEGGTRVLARLPLPVKKEER
jgi:signal transduction histidine kinase